MKDYKYILSWQPVAQESPKITTSSLETFNADTSNDSSVQYFDIQSSETNSDLTITSPIQFKISIDSIEWLDEITILQINYEIGIKRVYVKLEKGAIGTYTGTIVNTISGAIHNVSVVGVISEAEVTAIKYGSLYNYPSVVDVRGIANGDFDVPTDTEFATLVTYLGGASVAGGKLKEMGVVYWNSPNTGATNEVGFNGRSTGKRRDNNGTFEDIGAFAFYRTKTARDSTTAWTRYLFNAGTSFFSDYINNKSGIGVRLVRPATEAEQLQTDGSACTPYVGNDGKNYRTVKIGTQVLIADNLAETLFAIGDTDWYLPCISELEKMYVNLHSGTDENLVVYTPVGNFTNAGYWSSTEQSDTTSLGYLFNAATINADYKTVAYNVRQVRDFISTNIYSLRENIRGGLIYYIEDLGGGNYKYYISANEDAYSTLAWGTDGYLVGASGSLIGTGKANSTFILAKLIELAETDKAAQYADNYDSQIIPTVTDSTAWAALTSAARCAYDNDESNVLI